MNTEIVLGEIIICILGIYGFYSLNKILLTNRLISESSKLKGQMAKFRQDFSEVGQRPGEFVAGALGGIGIEGILDELGIDPGILNNPLVKGLVAQYAPKVIEQLGKKQEGVKSTKSNGDL
jgi:hypothetical protein